MSVSNLLLTETQNQEWSKIFCNELTTLTLNAPPQPVVPLPNYNNPVAYAGTTTGGGINTVVGDYPLYQEPNTSQDNSGGEGDFYHIISKGIQILKTGYYLVNIRAEIRMNFVADMNSFAVLIEGSPFANSLASSSVSTTGGDVNIFCVSGIQFIPAPTNITIGISSSNTSQTCEWKNWQMTISAINVA